MIAWTDKFAEHLTAKGKSGESGTAYIWFGKIGYAAKGIAIGIVGVLFLYAAVTHDPKKSGGLDQALQEVLEQPFGPFLLGVIARRDRLLRPLLLRSRADTCPARQLRRARLGP